MTKLNPEFNYEKGKQRTAPDIWDLAKHLQPGHIVLCGLFIISQNANLRKGFSDIMI